MKRRSAETSTRSYHISEPPSIMASVGGSRGCLLLLCVAAAALALVDAGGYRNGYKPPTRTAAELYMNYKEPVPLLKHHKAS